MSKSVEHNIINSLIEQGDCFTKEVNKCPKCKKGIQPVYLDDCVINGNELIIIHYCPICEETIISRYTGCNLPYDKKTIWYLNDLYPYEIGDDESENEIIKSISPKFYEIFNQSKTAESTRLKEICGMGYRKSLEYLIKDYAILKNPTEEDIIKSKSLKKCIDEYISYDQIKICAKGATFIGNDETHYIRKWDTRDVEDLKKLINMVIAWIDLVEQTERYSKEMNL